MSVILKANQLNTLIYKYFLESGLSHSAYTLFNQASLTQALQQFRFDIKAGHLLSILEKGLLYQKIQSHVNFSEYTDCEEPFFLLKPHMCKVVEKVRKERDDAMKEMEEQLNEGIRRTNSIYNTSIANREFEEIVYDSRGKKYFQKFAKIKLPAQSEQNQINKYSLTGSQMHTVLYNSDDYELDLLKYDSINEQIFLEKIFPSVRQGELSSSIVQAVTNEYIIQVFEDNYVTIFDLKEEQITPIEFRLPVTKQITIIEPNINIPQLVCFKNTNCYFIVNIKSNRIVKKGQGLFYWRIFDQFLVYKDDIIELDGLMDNTQNRRSYKQNVRWEEIQFNAGRNIFAAISYVSKIIHVYTLENQKPLFIFNFEEKLLKKVLFITSNSVDYLCWLTSDQINVFDLTLNSYSKIINLQEYDTQIRELCFLKKSDKDELYLLALGSENLLLYDITNSKTQRIQIQGELSQIKQISPSRVALTTDNTIYFMCGTQYIDPLFK